MLRAKQVEESHGNRGALEWYGQIDVDTQAVTVFRWLYKW